MVRTAELLRILHGQSLHFDIDEVFSLATTGLSLCDYQYLIFGILQVCLSFSPEKILSGEELLVDTKLSPTLTSLYEKLLVQESIPIGELKK